jgi:hypothetical protein
MTEASNEEAIVPWVGRRDQIKVATAIRSTWLNSSLRAVKERNLLDRYLEHLPKEHHEAVLGTIAGVWLPVEVGVAHYEAMNDLGLGTTEIVQIGKETSAWLHGSVFSIAVNLAKGAGVTPLTVLGQLPRFWTRSMQGGGVATFRTGPKDARLEFAGFPCARVGYCRVAVRGVIHGIMENFAHAVYVRDVASLCTSTSLGYRISWV